ncbi:MAG: hypothetical protein L6R37_008467, partial [Teloschistes peruensis]
GTDDLVVAAPSQDIKEGQNYGVKVLHNGGSGACVDILFVHGLTGNAYNTWLHKETGIYWPSELLRQDIPNSRILSFGYDAVVVHIFHGGPASNSRFSNHAESLVGKLVRARERSETETRKIIFVAHSLGSLITEQALTHSKNRAEQHLHEVELHTIGIVLLGVPHCGTDLEAWATVGRRMASILKRTNKDILGVLNPDSEMLHVVENDFHTLCGSDFSLSRLDQDGFLDSFSETVQSRGVVSFFYELHLFFSHENVPFQPHGFSFRSLQASSSGSGALWIRI